MRNLDNLDFAKSGGLLPAVIQHADTGVVLMLGYMSRAALDETLKRHRAVFYSRTKQRLWEKGETSGHTLEVKEVIADCDRDALLVKALPLGPTCHLGTTSCFGDGPLSDVSDTNFLRQLEKVIAERIETKPDGSYTAKLVGSGRARIAQKLGEEAVEAALAGAAGTDQEVVKEVADLLFHSLVMLRARGLSLHQVVQELKARMRTTSN
jgi:phosphoribosyl-AMP cyclohydrolase / phosphoribosyl-ATP pyrophosphohydrolase